ncbi:MAG TPA: YHS domain-containing (seleno)protein [Acidobacteriota bacterium]|nr:YHS domain-containing (seleno)protein [Acidobacteriota bacterium]
MKKTFLFLILTLILGSILYGKSTLSLQQRYNLSGEYIGISGYDPVAYFPEGGGKPAKGSIKIASQYKGVTYRFISDEHKTKFDTNPEKYLPLYGGWCAWAVGELGKRVDVDPESFEIRDGKLYLFYRDTQLETRALWLKDTHNLIEKATLNWKKLSE